MVLQFIAQTDNKEHAKKAEHTLWFSQQTLQLRIPDCSTSYLMGIFEDYFLPSFKY